MYAGNAYSSYSHGAYSGYSALSTANISYETNSKDPVLLRARVFVGNINPKFGRDEIIQLFRSYGTLLGVTVFKGYAFVQFSHGSEADLAVSALNGYNWLNSILDVKLAISGQQQLPHPHAHPLPHPKPAAHSPSVANTAKGMGKRNQNQFFQTPPSTNNKDQNQKRAKFDQIQHPGAGGQSQQMHDKNEVNKNYAAHLNDNDIANIHQNDNFDTLICGGCRFVTPDLAEFVEHRKHPCKLSKADDEPDALICTNCNEQFSSSWAFLTHVNSTHNNNTLYKEVFLPKLGENGTNDEDGAAEQTKNESADVSMEQFLELK